MVTANLLSGGVDEVFTRADSSGPVNFLADALGNTVALTNASGTTLAQYTYEPFGKTTRAGSSANPYQFTGRENDGAGLYFYRARYYNSTLQRFISEDPLGFGGGDVNFYSYVRNDPVSLFDPFGLRPGDKYPNAKCAGYNAVNDYNQTSIDQNKEYGGFIYKNPDGAFSHTDPHVNPSARFPQGLGVGGVHSLPGFWQLPIPAGTQRGGWYHTHAGGARSVRLTMTSHHKTWTYLTSLPPMGWVDCQDSWAHPSPKSGCTFQVRSTPNTVSHSH